MALVVGVTDKQRLLELLFDGRPHSHKEAYRLGLMAHSRAADLRKDGHDVQVWREGNTYWYLLALSEGEWPSPGGSDLCLGDMPELVKAGKTDAKSTPKIGTRSSPSESATCHNCGSTDYRHVTDDIFRCNACNAQQQEPEVLAPGHPALGAAAPFVPLPVSGVETAAAPEALFPDERHMYERETAA